MTMTTEEAEEWFLKTYVDSGVVPRLMKEQQQNEIDQLYLVLQFDKLSDEEAKEIQQHINEVQQRQTMRILKYGF